MRRFFINFLLIFSVLLAFSARAGDVVNITVGLHQAELVNLPKAMQKVIIADRSVAGVVKHSGRKVSVIGHAVGRTDIRFMRGKRIIRQVNLNVVYDVAAIKKSIHDIFPSEEVGVEVVSGAIALTGDVSDAQTAAQIVEIARQYVGGGADSSKILNLMKLRSGQQVMLRVRVGEVRREVLKRFGLATQGVLGFGPSFLGALEKQGLLRVLAEPTLTAISGETAEFLAGGEFPVPVSGEGGVAVDYKSFGVSVDFTPVVLRQNRLRIDVASEVSELLPGDSVTISSLKVPSIATRRANTTVELAPGESFVIAGLIKNNHKVDIKQVPGLGDVPVLSSLFRSGAFRRNETELVIAVTPYLVSPVEGADIRLPGEDLAAPSMLDLMFLGAVSGKAAKEAPLEGAAGFALD